MEADLLAHHAQEFHDRRIRHRHTIDLQPQRFAHETRVGLRHFPVERKRQVGVDLFLELKEPQLRAIPRARLEHDQHGLPGLRVVGHDVDDVGVFDAAKIVGKGVGMHAGAEDNWIDE